MNKFYKKVNPKNPLWLSGRNEWATFTRVSDQIGILVTGDEGVQRELDQIIREQKGGLSAISQAEFMELDAKKNEQTTSKPNWREEWSPGKQALQTYTPPGAPPPARDAVGLAAAVEKPPTGGASAATPPAPAAAPAAAPIPASAIPRPRASKR